MTFSSGMKQVKSKIGGSTMAVKNCRNMKVYEQSGYHYKSTPTIMLKGLWLKAFGFSEGTQIQVQCEDGKLIITKAQEPVTE